MVRTLFDFGDVAKGKRNERGKLEKRRMKSWKKNILFTQVKISNLTISFKFKGNKIEKKRKRKS